MDILIEVFAAQKTQREQLDTFLLQQIPYVTWNPCCYHGKLVSLFIEMPEKCSCHGLRVVATVSVLYFFTLA